MRLRFHPIFIKGLQSQASTTSFFEGFPWLGKSGSVGVFCCGTWLIWLPQGQALNQGEEAFIDRFGKAKKIVVFIQSVGAIIIR